MNRLSRLLLLAAAAAVVSVVLFADRIQAWRYRDLEPRLHSFIAAVAARDSIAALKSGASPAAVHNALEWSRHEPDSLQGLSFRPIRIRAVLSGGEQLTLLAPTVFRGQPDVLRFELRRSLLGWVITSMYVESAV